MSEMILTFWGTRGSIPTPGKKTEKYGGNTTCLEVRVGEQIVVVDAGSGIREMSVAWDHEFGSRSISTHLLLTHHHWDHIQGFPFFTAAYRPGNTCVILGDMRPASSPEALLNEQMHGAFFPVPLAAMQAELQFKPIESEFRLGELNVKTTDLPHPGGCIGYRFELGDSALVIATDSELDQVALNAEEVAKDFAAPRQYAPEFLRFFEGADLLVIDCQYSDEEYAGKKGWGHNSIAAVVDLCRQVNPSMVALTHHDPLSTDEVVMRRTGQVEKRLVEAGARETLGFAAREGVKMRVKPLI